MRILVIRLGAWGDSVIITPLLRHLKSQGNEVYLHTSEIGGVILKGNPYIDKFLPYVSNSVPDDKLQEYWTMLAKENGCEKTINLCESIERALSCHPVDPFYNLPKQARFNRCNRNFYEYAFTHAGIHDVPDTLIPELYFTDEEETAMENWFKQFNNRFVVIWGLSGSGMNKAYPWTDNVIGEILREYKNAVVITVGDALCQALEIIEDKRVIRRSGKWSMRESALACKFADLVVAPDTGLIHSAGCFDTPKICLIGSNTIENITKHFVNDFSIEADEKITACAPCFRLIYSASTQCPIHEETGIPVCMSLGIDPRKVFERIQEVHLKFGVKNEHSRSEGTIEAC